MKPQTLHDYIIFPTLNFMGPTYNTPAIRQLLLATCAQESHCGQYLKQIKGPALGLYQMEPATVKDLYTNFVAYDKERQRVLEQFISPAAAVAPQLISLVGELFYATALARMNYRRVKEAVPAFNSFPAMWAYYKKYWNSTLGAATEREFQANWNAYVREVDFSDPANRIAPYTSVV